MPIPSYLKCHKCNANVITGDMVLSRPHIISNPTEKQKTCNQRVGHSSLRHSLDLFLDLGKEFISRIIQMVSFLSVIFLDSFISKENVVRFTQKPCTYL
jgi:hypothetical protein